jgi:hypothetical protein
MCEEEITLGQRCMGACWFDYQLGSSLSWKLSTEDWYLDSHIQLNDPKASRILVSGNGIVVQSMTWDRESKGGIEGQTKSQRDRALKGGLFRLS